MNNTHSHCTHEATKAARTACRKLRAQGVDTTAGVEDIAAARLHRSHSDHTLNCCWHAVMAIAENWVTSQVEDPTAEWCKGDPTPAVLVEAASDLIGDYCHCDH